MKVLLDIKDDKVDFVLELLRNFRFVKAEPLTPYKAEVFEGIRQAVEEMNLIKSGKLQPNPIKDLLDEL
jgi:hypothetical protein